MISLPYLTVVLLLILGLYCVVVKRNIIKIILGMAILSDSVNLFLIVIGYKAEGIAPILTEELIHDLPHFYEFAVDPLPQAFVLTAIVIAMSVTAFALGLAVKIYEHYGTLDSRKLRRLRG